MAGRREVAAVLGSSLGPVLAHGRSAVLRTGALSNDVHLSNTTSLHMRERAAPSVVKLLTSSRGLRCQRL